MEVLLLCDYRPEGAATVVDHINALSQYTGHRVRRLSLLGDLPAALDLDRFDAVIIHYSLILSRDEYVSAETREKLRRYEGIKISFIQDEYRWVNQAVDALAYVGVDLLFTCVPEPDIDRVYSPAKLPKLRKINTLTGFVPKELIPLPCRPYAERTIDVGYRARKLSALFGSLAREKSQIAERFLADAPRFNLSTDISCQEADRLYGQDWIDFVRNCRAMLGSESGASVFDFDGELQPAIERYEREHPEASFEEVEARFFAGQDGLIRMNQISPRCFEAAALRTMMILYEGAYSGVLEPWRHYVPLKKDHSNIGDVIDVLRNEERWSEIVDRAYREIALSPRWSYQSFGEKVGSELTRMQMERGRQPAIPYNDSEFLRTTMVHQVTLTGKKRFAGSLYSMVERLPGPVFRSLRTIRRALFPRR